MQPLRPGAHLDELSAQRGGLVLQGPDWAPSLFWATAVVIVSVLEGSPPGLIARVVEALTREPRMTPSSSMT
jgi:hypothetical protein